MTHLAGSTLTAGYLLAVSISVLAGSEGDPFASEMQLQFGAGNVAPALEISLAPLNGEPQRLVVVSIYNQAPGTNVLAAHVYGPPFDGSGAQFFDAIDSGAIFALGDGCMFDDGATQLTIFPYILRNLAGNFFLRTATFDGTQWDVLSHAGFDYDSADCANPSATDLWFTAHDTQKQSIDFFQANLVQPMNLQFRFCVGGVDACVDGDTVATGDDILGPTAGATRDNLAASKPLGAANNLLALMATYPSGVQLTEYDFSAPVIAPTTTTSVVPGPSPPFLAAVNESSLVRGSIRPGVLRDFQSAFVRNVDANTRDRTFARVSPLAGTTTSGSIGAPPPPGDLGFVDIQVLAQSTGATLNVWSDVIVLLQRDGAGILENLGLPASWLGEGPVSGCRFDFTTSDWHVLLADHQSGGISATLVRGDQIYSDDFRVRANYNNTPFDPITDSSAFASCP